MKYIDRSLVDEPEILKGQTAPSKDEEVDSDIYGHEDVKTALKKLQNGICCYCESYYAHTTYGDVEHYRPKGYYQQYKGDKQHRPGYYWLAYKWENLMYACEVCNRTYKKNYFPLKDPDKRFKRETLDISREEPLLINPYEEKNIEKHLTFEENRIKPLTDEGKASIDYYGLDRRELDESRRGIYNEINAFVDLAELSRGTHNEVLAQNKVKSFVKQKIDDGQHTLMIKCDFGDFIK